MRESGILMHISSLPSDYGIGSLGKEAYKFAEFLKLAQQHYWQVLPLGHTSFGDSPYQTFSAFAGNPYFIDLDLLYEQGLIAKPVKQSAANINYGELYEKRYQILQNINISKINSTKLAKFCKKNSFWLDDYALFMALKNANGGKPWCDWANSLKFREESAILQAKTTYSKQIIFWQAIQYLFFEQWTAFKKYVNSLNIKIIGDMPIYVAYDSSDVWASPHDFLIDSSLTMTDVAGVPPDYFSPTGQLWGNPLYDWEKMKKDNFSWWVRRLEESTKLFDKVRIDHFRAFDTYYKIKFGELTAVKGVWEQGPGYSFFEVIKKALPNADIIAEDLGDLFPSVYELLEKVGYPGMRVLQFGITGEDNIHNPANFVNENLIAYTGTHDNNTTQGWIDALTQSEKIDMMTCTQRFDGTDVENVIKWALASKANIAIIPMQDILALDKTARMNIPSTTQDNWAWVMKKCALTAKANKLSKWCEKYNRNN